MVDLKALIHVTPEMLENYDLIGLGSPIWKADTKKVGAFYKNLPHQKG